jgi:hypothetical protein
MVLLEASERCSSSRAVWLIVYLPPAVARPIAQVVRLDADNAPVDRPAEHSGCSERLEELREDRDDVESHRTDPK